MKKKRKQKKYTIFIVIGIIILGILTSLYLDKKYKESDNPVFARNKLNIWNGASEETKAHLQKYQSKLDDIDQYISDITYYNKSISSEDVEKITDKVIKFGSWFMVEMFDWEEEQEEILNDLYNWDGAKEDNFYQQQLRDVQSKAIANGNKFYDYCLELNDRIELIFKTTKKISSSDYNEIREIYDKMDVLAIVSFAKTKAEQEKLLK